MIRCDDKMIRVHTSLLGDLRIGMFGILPRRSVGGQRERITIFYFSTPPLVSNCISTCICISTRIRIRVRISFFKITFCLLSNVFFASCPKTQLVNVAVCWFTSVAELECSQRKGGNRVSSFLQKNWVKSSC